MVIKTRKAKVSWLTKKNGNSWGIFSLDLCSYQHCGSFYSKIIKSLKNRYTPGAFQVFFLKFLVELSLDNRHNKAISEPGVLMFPSCLFSTTFISHILIKELNENMRNKTWERKENMKKKSR